jgi:phosphonate transport system ATP-binding protein
MLELRGICVPGRQRPRLNNLSFSLASGERVALLGASGAGKSTLLAVANGLIKPTAGVVYWHGEAAANGGRRLRQQARIGTLWQDLRLVEQLTVQQSLNCGRLTAWPWHLVLLNLLIPLETSACSKVLAQVELTADLLPVPIIQLSGGQRQRIALGRLLRQGADLLLADEPLAQLDPPLAAKLLNLLLELGSAPRALLMSLHRPDLLQGFDRVLGLRCGELVFDTHPARISASQLQDLYESDQHKSDQT